MTTTTDKKAASVTVINIPEAVGVFDTFEALQAANNDLQMVGFSRYDISLLGDQKILHEKLGKAYWHSSDLEDDPKAPRAAFVSEEAIGELKGAIAGFVFCVVDMMLLHANHCRQWKPEIGSMDRKQVASLTGLARPLGTLQRTALPGSG